MDSNTNILLQELIETIKGPDWWTIGITAVNALIMISLGWQQYKLQQFQTELHKRQTEAQEYELYKKLYTLLSNANQEIDSFLRYILNGFWLPYHFLNKDFLQHKQSHIEFLCKNITDNYLDYNLKFSKESFNPDSYQRILSLMTSLLKAINNAINDNDVEFTDGCQRIYYKQDNEDTALAASIIEQFKKEKLKNMLTLGFDSFIKQKHELCRNHNFLNMLQDKCKIDKL